MLGNLAERGFDDNTLTFCERQLDPYRTLLLVLIVTAQTGTRVEV